MDKNPFINGNPVALSNFIGRKKEIRRIGSRINSCQSTAIVGEPRSGKTSLLLYIADQVAQQQLSNEKFKKIYTCYIDAHTLGSNSNQEEFWKTALNEIYETLIKSNPDCPISESYHICADNGFRTQVLENFLRHLEKNECHLVLLLDEFDLFIHHPILNSAEFFGSLRSLSSRIPSLSLVMASRQSLASLNSITQIFNQTGSPYFNFLSEINIGSLSLKEADQLLNLGSQYFTQEDKDFIKQLAGLHPYLLQSACSSLWEIYLDNEITDAEERLEQLHNHLYETTHLMLSSTWQIWSPQTRKAMTIISLFQTPELINRQFNTEEIFFDIRDLGPELRKLETQGFIQENNESHTSWTIRPIIFVHWITDEIIRTVREKSTFDEWIRIQEWDGLLTKGEKEKLLKAGKYFSEIIKDIPKEAIKAILQK